MEYVYAAMLLHKAGQKVTEDALTKVLSAASVKADNARVKALVTALDKINIDDAIAKAAVAPVAAAAASPAAGAAEQKKSAEQEAKKEEEAAEGLAALFG